MGSPNSPPCSVLLVSVVLRFAHQAAACVLLTSIRHSSVLLSGVACCDVCSIGLPNLIVNRPTEINLIGNKHYSFDFTARKSDTSGMTAQDLLEYFGTKAAIARALGVSSPSVAEWFYPDIGVPEGRQYQAQIATKGKLKADLPALRKKAA